MFPIEEGAVGDRRAHLLHKAVEGGDVVDREEPQPEDLVAREEVAHVRAREVPAAVAVASLLDGRLVERPLRGLDGDVAAARDGGAVARDARRDHAVEHVDAARDALRHLVQHAEPHHVARRVLRQERHRGVDRLVHAGLRLADGNAADGVAVEADLHELFRAVPPQVVVDAALDDAEDELAVGVRLVLRGARPAERLLDRLRRARVVARIRQALVEDHRDVAAQDALHLHRLLGAEEELVAVQVRAEAAALFGQLAHLREGKHLEAARVGEEGAVPSHEAVKPAGRRDDGRARSQQEVVGVAEDDLRAGLQKVARLQRLDGAERADIHENGGLNRAVGGLKPPQTGFRARVFL